MMDETAEKRSIYLLSPKAYGAETIAVTFAKTSRSPLSFHEIAEELTEAQAAQFHEKWVVGYGHASVAEHAVLHLAFENISRLAVECLQSNRLASYTEKSTRYQQWDPDCYCCPPELKDSPLSIVFQQSCRNLFSLYGELIQPAMAYLKRTSPAQTGERSPQDERRIRSLAVDSIRFLLPAAALANVGMTANARTLAHAIRKMLSHPLAEVRAIGEETLLIAREEAPTLVRYVEPVPFLMKTRSLLNGLASDLPAATGAQTGVHLLRFDPAAEEHLLAAYLYASGSMGLKDVEKYVHTLERGEKAALLKRWLGERDEHDALPRETEQVLYTFEVILDQGAYYELKRHRMMTQLPQPLTTDLGYEMPRLVEEMGAGDRYRAVMDQAREAYDQLAAWNADVAAYVVPNGFRRRVVLTTNLRQLGHFCELRSTGKAHYSIREVAFGMVEQIKSVHPLLGKIIKVPEGVSAEAIGAEMFSR